MLYSLCDKYTKGVKSHTTILCKRWTSAQKDRTKWRGRTTSIKT
jgi:hypothetical protein